MFVVWFGGLVTGTVCTVYSQKSPEPNFRRQKAFLTSFDREKGTLCETYCCYFQQQENGDHLSVAAINPYIYMLIRPTVVIFSNKKMVTTCQLLQLIHIYMLVREIMDKTNTACHTTILTA
jgi:hypothetical protein